MKTKVLVLLVVVALVFVVASVIQTAPKTKQPLSQAQDDERIEKLKEKEKRGHINLLEAAELAKSRGKNRAVVSGLVVNYMGTAGNADELDEKLTDYTVVVAKLVDKKSFMQDEGRVRTWNKFQILDTLHTAPPVPPYVTWPPISEELLPLGEDEIIVHTYGGTVTIDGVEVSQSDSDVSAFRKSQKYVLALKFESQSNIGILALGPQGYLLINEDESLNEAMDKYLLQEVIKRRHDGSVRQFKEKIKTRSASK